MTMHILIFANGLITQSATLDYLVTQADLTIAADGGANNCARLNIIPDMLIGDLDSIDQQLLRVYENSDVDIKRFPPHKDATDLELALDEAQHCEALQTWIIGGLGGRWDMSIANIMLAAAKKYATQRISLLGEDSTLHILHPGKMHNLESEPGQTVSIIPLLGNAAGITLQGFKYPLNKDTITFGSSRGISNITVKRRPSITHNQGILLCIQGI